MTDFINSIGYIIRQIKRVYFFKKQLPLLTLAKEVFLLPRDYYCRKGRSSGVRHLTITVTNACNQSCRWCFYKKGLTHRQELPLDLYNQLIDDVYRDKPAIQLTGGEPFLNHNIFAFIQKAKRHNLPIFIFTNGTLLNKEHVDRLIDLGVDYLCISAIVPRSLHCEVTNTNLYEQLISNLEYLRDVDRKGMKLIVNITLFKGLMKHSSCVDDLITKYHIDGLRVQHLSFLYPNEFKDHKEVFIRRFNCDREIYQNSEFDEFCIDDLNAAYKLIRNSKTVVQQVPPLSMREMKQWYLDKPFRLQRKCIYPWRGAQIGADGNVYLCYKICYPLGSLKEKSFYDIWNNDKYRIVRLELKKELFPGCARCCKL